MLLVRRFAQTLQRCPCYVKLVGLPLLDWEDYLEDLTKDFKLVLHENPTYICLQTESEPEADRLLQLLHNHTIPNTEFQLQAIRMVSVDDETWTHPLFHVRPDFAVQPEPLTEELKRKMTEDYAIAEEMMDALDVPKEIPEADTKPDQSELAKLKQEKVKQLILANPPKVV